MLFKAIVAAKTRNAMIFRPSARAARCAERAIEILREAGEAAGHAAGALQVIPDPTLDVSQYLFHHPGVDFIWTTGGPKAVAAANAAGKPCLSVGAGNAPVYVHRSADVADGGRRHADLQDLRRVGDLPRRADAASSTTPVYDDMVAELERMGARLLSEDEVDALGGGRVRRRRPVRAATRSASRARRSARSPASRPRRRQGPARAAADRPRGAARRTRSCARS